MSQPTGCWAPTSWCRHWHTPCLVHPKSIIARHPQVPSSPTSVSSSHGWRRRHQERCHRLLCHRERPRVCCVVCPVGVSPQSAKAAQMLGSHLAGARRVPQGKSSGGAPPSATFHRNPDRAAVRRLGRHHRVAVIAIIKCHQSIQGYGWQVDRASSGTSRDATSIWREDAEDIKIRSLWRPCGGSAVGQWARGVMSGYPGGVSSHRAVPRFSASPRQGHKAAGHWTSP